MNYQKEVLCNTMLGTPNRRGEYDFISISSISCIMAGRLESLKLGLLCKRGTKINKNTLGLSDKKPDSGFPVTYLY